MAHLHLIQSSQLPAPKVALSRHIGRRRRCRGGLARDFVTLSAVSARRAGGWRIGESGRLSNLHVAILLPLPSFRPPRRVGPKSAAFSSVRRAAAHKSKAGQLEQHIALARDLHFNLEPSMNEREELRRRRRGSRQQRNSGGERRTNCATPPPPADN